MVLKQDGSVWTTGCNGSGQLGTGTLLSSKIFVKVMPSGKLSAIIQAACNSLRTLLLPINTCTRA